MSSILFYSTRIRKKIEIRFFFDFFSIFWSPVSRIVPKNVKGGSLGVFENPFFCKIEKIEEGPFGDIKKDCEKKSHKAEITCTKNFWSRAGLEPTSFCLADLKKPN